MKEVCHLETCRLKVKIVYMSMDISPVFTGIDDEYIALLQPLFERVTYPANTTVIEQGALAEFLYLIESGKVEIFYKPYDDEIITITHVEANGLFGWSALIGSTKYSSSGIAIEELSALRIRGRDLRNLCQTYPQAGAVILDRLASVVSSRWQNAHDQVKSILQNGINT